MSEKVKFGTNEFNLIPMGSFEDPTKKTRYFKFISALSYSEIIAIATNPNNYSTITIIGQDGSPQNTYADCVSFKGMNYEKDVHISENETADVYTVTYSIDAVEKVVKLLNTQIDDLSNTIVIISMM